MEAKAKTGFLKNYTFKKWMKHSASIFAFVYFCDLLGYFIFDRENFSDAFQYKNLLAWFITCLLFGFFSCLVAVKPKKQNQI